MIATTKAIKICDNRLFLKNFIFFIPFYLSFNMFTIDVFFPPFKSVLCFYFLKVKKASFTTYRLLSNINVKYIKKQKHTESFYFRSEERRVGKECRVERGVDQ